MSLKQGLLACSAVIAITSGGSVQAQDSTSSPPEIIVTAQKRSESLQNVPISITAVGTASLESGSVDSVNDALRSVPGVASFNTFQGGMTKFTVRGVTSNPSPFNGAAVVGYYLDEIPFAFVRFPYSPDTSAYDLERVEVLRGPQGTLYGASALNGVVRILTKDADLDDVQVKARVSAFTTRAGDESFKGDAAINLPIIPGRLALRAVLGYADLGGWIDLPNGGIRDVNDSKTKTLRLKLNAEPVDGLKIETLAWFSRNESGSSNSSRDDRTWLARFRQPATADFDAYGLTLSYDFPTMSVLSATSYIDFSNSLLLDAPVGGDRFYQTLGSKLWSEELRLVSTGEGPWQWSLGGIYRDAKDIRDQRFDKTFPLPLDFRFGSRSYALFGELSRRLLDDRLTITGGLRYFKDRQTYHENGFFTPGPLLPDRVDTFDAITPRAVISFRPNRDLSVYASYSQGFRSGFSNDGFPLRQFAATPAVKPDRLHNFEAGAKGRLLNGLLDIDSAIYFIKWKDTIQILNNIVVGPTGTFGVQSALNAGSASGMGVDLGATLRPVPGLDIGGTISWNDLKFDQSIPSGTVILFDKGDRMPESPKLTATAQIGYGFDVSDAYSARFSANLSYLSKSYSLGSIDKHYGDAITQLDLNLKLSSRNGWSLSLFANNLFDEDGRVRVNTLQPVSDYADRLRPRSVGAQFEIEI